MEGALPLSAGVRRTQRVVGSRNWDEGYIVYYSKLVSEYKNRVGRQISVSWMWSQITRLAGILKL